jgi:flagellar biosynthetic protein FlhB
VVIVTGAGRLAERICKLARRHGIPIVSAPPLARALYFHATPGETIPTALFQACAEILAYVWRLQAWASGQGQEPTPPSEADLGVDERLDPIARRKQAY